MQLTHEGQLVNALACFEAVDVGGVHPCFRLGHEVVGRNGDVRQEYVAHYVDLSLEDIARNTKDIENREHNGTNLEV